MRRVCLDRVARDAHPDATKTGSRQNGAHGVISRIRSDTEHHDFGRFDQRGDGLAFFEAHLSRGVGGNDGGDDLAADGKTHLGEEAFDFQLDNAADELIAAADGAHHLALRGFRTLRLKQQRVEFRFRDAVVATRSFDGLEFAAVDPLFDGGIGDAEPQSRFTRGEEGRHSAILDENGRFL